jgi:ATP-dependent DNA helicase DinG
VSTPTITPANFAEAQEVLAAALPGYTKRPHQMALAEVIEWAITDKKCAALQAGTGTGKSLALLIPIILSGLRGVVATSTKALQSQYAKHDLPFLQEHLGVQFSWAVLKGRSNYPCHAKAEEITSPTRSQHKVLDQMAACSTPDAIRDRTIIDREDFPGLTEEDWRDFSMSAAECPGAKSCPFAEKCFAERAKARAAEADVVVTNTAYLMQDIQLRSATEGNVALLGDFDVLAIDEAHNLEAAATGALEDTLGQGGYAKLGRDLGAFLEANDADTAAAEAIEPAAAELWRVLGMAYDAFLVRSKGKTDPMSLPQGVIIDGDLGAAFINLYNAIKGAREAVKNVTVFEDHDRIVRSRILRRSLGQLGRIERYTTDSDDVTVRWLEQETSTWRGERRTRLFLRSAPIRVAPFLRKALWSVVPTILSSATLTTASAKNGAADFSYMLEQLGLDDFDPLTFDAGSPFDYQRQTKTFIAPKSAPEPAGRTVGEWRTYAQATSLELVRASKGGAFLLYTSRSAMNDAHRALAPMLEQMGLLVLKQGDYPTSEMVRLFKENGNAVLFGLKSFFEGVDISGRALRLVILDKLPFGVPTDLLLQARCEWLDRKYGKWGGFSHLTIPAMTLTLIQAHGRLVRHMDDQGLFAILDNRMWTKRYGTQIRAALPQAPETSDINDAVRYLGSLS